MDASKVTRLIESILDADGDDVAAAEELLPAVYSELRNVARGMIAKERSGQTLQPTALVHEAYMRVVGSSDPGWQGRRHFFGAATEAMRRILINQARRKGRVKHGGEHQRVAAEEVDVAIEPPADDILEVDAALLRLEKADKRSREIVNLRYFGGLTVEETAETMGLSVSTVEREWRFIRAWLKDALGSNDAS